MDRVKQLALVVGLFAAALGFMALIGASHRRSFDEAQAALPEGEAEQELRVDHSACRYLFPGPADLALGRLVCPSCFADAHRLHERYEVRRGQPRCESRGSNTLWVKRRPAVP